jgi:hypothetical protein
MEMSIAPALPPMNGGPPAAGETPIGQELIDASLSTALLTVQKIRATDSGAEAKDYAASVLALAQVIALLDPTRDTQGVPLSHQLTLQKQKGEQELAKVKEQSRAAAQTPTKRVTATKGPNGSRSYEVQG